MVLAPEQYDAQSPFVLLQEAEQGRVGFDHRLLRSLLSRPESTLDALDRFTRKRNDDRLVDLDEQLLDIYRALKSPRAVPYLIKMLRNATEDAPDALTEAFVETGAPAVDALTELYDELGSEDGGDARFILAAIGVKDDRIRRILLSTLRLDPFEGAICLGIYRDPSTEEDVRAALLRSSDAEKHALQQCLDEITSGAPPHPLPPFDIYALYPEKASPLFAALKEEDCLEFLSSSVDEYRMEAALSFSDGHISEAVKDKLIELARSDPEYSVRGAALRALGETAGEPAVRSLLIDTLEDNSRSWPERAGALVGLAVEPSVKEILARFIPLFYGEADKRATALQAMWRTLDGRWRDVFPRHLSDTNPVVRLQAVHGMGAFGVSPQAHLLVPLLQDEELREDTLFAYALCLPGKTTEKGVHKLLEVIREHAGGLGDLEEEAVCFALDQRLQRVGLDPVFFPEEGEE